MSANQNITHTSQVGKPGACFLAQLFDAEGLAIATIDPTADPSVATERARRMVACWNACAGFDTDVLEKADLHESAYAAEGRQFDLTRERNAMLVALQAYEEAFEAMFVQCCSNPITDAWGRPVDMTKLNQAHQLAQRALRARPTESGAAI